MAYTFTDATLQALVDSIKSTILKDALAQYTTMPTASATFVNDIIQYLGADTANYTSDSFYRCVAQDTDPVTYAWEQVDFGNDTPHWSGTRAEYEAIKNTLEAGTYVSITDDYDDGLEIVDVVEEDNMNPITSNAIAELVKPIVDAPVAYSGNVRIVTPETFTNFVRSGNVVTVSLYFGFDTGALAGNNQVLFTGLPKPKKPVLFVLSTNTQDASIKEKSCVVQLNTDGNILTSFAPTHIGTSAHVCGAFSYVTED